MLFEKYNFETYDDFTKKVFNGIESQEVISKIWEKDFTVWEDKPDEITNRLGWLDSPKETLAQIEDINNFVDEIRNAGFTHALLMGMGGSSLAPEVFGKVFGVKEDYINLSVIDSTHPESVLAMKEKFDPSKTLYIVSTKSGGTVETISFMKYFYNHVKNELGESAGDHFVAITDPGSGLEKMAEDLKFRKIFRNNPNIGGRFSALSLFGMVPAALIGADINNLLQISIRAAENSKKSINENIAAQLGGLIGGMSNLGIDKLQFILSPEIFPFGAWVEQLIAESMGKSGKGILPVISEKSPAEEMIQKDRLIVYLKLASDSKNKEIIEKLLSAGIPLIILSLDHLTEIMSQFFIWEFATAVMGWVLQVHPFDQPNVESAKIRAREMVDAYKVSGKLPALIPAIEEGGMKIYFENETENIEALFKNLFSDAASSDLNVEELRYVSIQAFLPFSSEVDLQLKRLCERIESQYKIAVTLGYGPRFLHSTGQLHKGDGGKGIFIQITGEIKNDIDIPDSAGDNKSSMSFGVLITAQAMGDRQALLDSNRKVVSINLGDNIQNSLEKIISVV